MIIFAIVLLIVIFGATSYAYTTKSWPFSKQNNAAENTKQFGSPDTNPSTDIPTTNNDKNNSNSDGTTSSKDSVDTNSQQKNTSLSVNEIVKPVGTFVSNHSPNLSGNPAPNTIVSTCRTSPHIDCVITFSKDGLTKSLPVQTTDANGNTNWNWQLQDLNLTAGDWQISVTATSGNTSQTSNDVMPLRVRE